MDIDPREIVENARPDSDEEPNNLRFNRLNAAVAVTIAVLATFMGICKVKDDNIVQAMQQAQADKIDHWAFYQARNLRQELAEATATQLDLARLSAPPSATASYDTAVQKYRALAQDQAKKKEDLRVQAENDQKTYDSLNYRDDQFDLSDALISIAIAMLAVTALTRMWSLYWASLIPTVFGVLMGIAGLTALAIHPDALMKLLS
jgi:hypothetical protein